MRNAVLIWFRQVGIKAQNFISLYCLHRSSNYCNNNNNNNNNKIKKTPGNKAFCQSPSPKNELKGLNYQYADAEMELNSKVTTAENTFYKMPPLYQTRVENC